MSFRRTSVLAVILAALPAPAFAEEAAKPLPRGKQYEGVVRIENAAIQPDYRTPWNGARPTGGSGTGFLIGPNRFLTNAHVVSNATRLIIKRVDDAQPRLAKLEFIAHDCDLALISVYEPKAFEDVKPLQLAEELPLLDTEVVAVGYPVGGERLSVTRGVVSRTDFRSYSHSGVDQHLTIQIDAAINPGNSGGPIVQHGKVVGVAFQGYSGAVAQNTGYIIPVPVITRFLKDIEDGKYDYYADLALSDFPLENPAMRKALGLPDNGMGVLIAHVDSEGTCGGILRRGDVLLEIDRNPIASDGFIDLGGERVNMNEIVERKFAGEKISLKIWRERHEEEAEVTLKRLTSYLMMANQYEKRPEYIVFAGLVFQPLDRNLMSAFNLNNDEVRFQYNYYSQEELYKERPEIVILTQVLADAINSHINAFAGRIVDDIDGVKIRKMEDVVQALQKPDGEFFTIKLLGEGRPLVLDKTQVAAAQARINAKYGVREEAYVE
ncbi:MAG: trypsin-like peptidase domain-containing protein [Verrucomicrobiales bacterium]